MESRGINAALHLDISHCPIQKQTLWNSAVVGLCSEGHGSNIRRYTSYPEAFHISCQFHEVSGGTRPRLRHKNSFPEPSQLLTHSLLTLSLDAIYTYDMFLNISQRSILK